jgi:hypothetical protein
MIFGISKTSINGALALLIVIGMALLVSGSPLIGNTVTLWITLILGVLRAVVGFTQGDAPATGAASNGPQKVVGLLLVIGLSAGVLGIAGCTDWERTTYQSLSASKAVIDSAAADYRAGTIKQTKPAYDLIEQAQKAQIVAVKAMGDYEVIKASGANSVGLQAAQVEAMTALAVIPPLVIEIKALYLTK